MLFPIMSIEQDGIEYGIAQDLIDAGVAPEDVVSFFQTSSQERENMLIAA